MGRSIATGLGLVSFTIAALAMGCTAGADDEPIGAADEAVNWSGCPNDVPITTANYAPPHAFPGRCFGAGNPQQAHQDGAFPELVGRCQTYCGQSHPACGRAAQLVNLSCMDRDIGHRWGALCVCGH